MLILNSPSNPTGVTMTADEVHAAAELAKKHDLLVISDEIYVPFLYGEAATVPSLSGPVREDDPAARLQQDLRHDRLASRLRRRPEGDHRADDQASAVHVRLRPSPFQHAALTALDLPVDEHVAAYRRKRDIVVEELGETFDLTTPDGAFYAFCEVPRRSA